MASGMRASFVVAGALALSAASAGAWTSGPFIAYFGFGSAELDERALATLDHLAQTLHSVRDSRVLIEGHADRKGPAWLNRRLSCRRARAAHAALLERRVAPERMAVRAHGEDRPLVDTDDEVREPQNRRVEFLFVDEAEIARANAEPRC